MSNQEEPVLEVKFDDLQALFDLAVRSLDFGSGFWVSEDVEVARRIALLIGVDPWEATPHNFKTSYRHVFEPRARGEYIGRGFPMELVFRIVCKTCGAPLEQRCHWEDINVEEPLSDET